MHSYKQNRHFNRKNVTAVHHSSHFDVQLCLYTDCGGMVSLDGMPSSALLEGGTRDEVVGGMESKLVQTEPSQTYPTPAFI